VRPMAKPLANILPWPAALKPAFSSSTGASKPSNTTPAIRRSRLIRHQYFPAGFTGRRQLPPISGQHAQSVKRSIERDKGIVLLHLNSGWRNFQQDNLMACCAASTVKDPMTFLPCSLRNAMASSAMIKKPKHFHKVIHRPKSQ